MNTDAVTVYPSVWKLTVERWVACNVMASARQDKTRQDKTFR